LNYISNCNDSKVPIDGSGEFLLEKYPQTERTQNATNKGYYWQYDLIEVNTDRPIAKRKQEII